MKKIYYITRSYLPDVTGGTLVRKGQVEYFRSLGYRVIVVHPTVRYKRVIEEGDDISVPWIKNERLCYHLERPGILEDYLDFWVKRVVALLKKQITPEDIVFATTGGELGCIKAGSLLKKQRGCRFIINYHDPVDYTTVNNRVLNNSFHIKRDRLEWKYIQNCDAVITSSCSNRDSLKTKYPSLSEKIRCSYFGYLKKVHTLPQRSASEKKRIVYGGAFTVTQAPELLAESVTGKDFQCIYIGRHEGYKPVAHLRKRARFLEAMQPDEYLEFMTKHADIGFVSLTSDYLGACVPSKIYEYINLGIPVLGALPQGDAMDIINNNGYGVAVHYSDREGLKKAAERIIRNYEVFRASVLKDREKWSLENQMEITGTILDEVCSGVPV